MEDQEQHFNTRISLRSRQGDQTGYNIVQNGEVMNGEHKNAYDSLPSYFYRIAPNTPIYHSVILQYKKAFRILYSSCKYEELADLLQTERGLGSHSTHRLNNPMNARPDNYNCNLYHGEERDNAIFQPEGSQAPVMINSAISLLTVV